jgi:nicotinamidase-related amidase
VLKILAAVSLIIMGMEKGDRTMLVLNLRAQIENPGADNAVAWREVRRKRTVPAKEAAIVICDMWDKHWCKSATNRCEALAKKMAPVLEFARKKGVLIIHAPSECMDFYEDTPQRKMAMEAPKADPPPARNIADPALPIDDSDGGCDDEPQCSIYKAWVRENPALRVADGDAVSDKGQEIYNLLRSRGINTLFIMGVHTNMCVMNRTFAIKQMTRWGVPCVLVRDLTDTMYNPRMRPQVSHDDGTALVISHIEKYWCPTIQSKDLLAGK